MPDIALAVLIFSPLALTYFLKANAALSFLALCVGFVLSTSVVGDLKRLLSQTNLSVSDSTLAATLILVPFLVTLLLSRNSIGKGIMPWLQMLSALAAGGLLALSVGPLLSSTQFNVMHSNFWSDLIKIQAGVIGAGAFLSLVSIWQSSFKHSKRH